jgi:acetylornithine/succinyldiaminopimelate/putrescine aminotransferase/predicted amino acid dehydrogenase
MPDLSRTTSDLYGQYCRQYIVDRLKAVGLDAVYTRASGDRVWREQNGKLVEVLDMAGGYGATLFGHNHPALVKKMKELLDQQVPVLTQASCRAGAAILAQRLIQLVGDDYVTIFTNSGTETVEAAIKHAYLAYLEQHRAESPVFWAVQGAFHGKTIGAIQLTPHYREPFDGLGPQVRFLDPDDPVDWENAWEETAGRVVAAFVEPIQGEGGIRPLPEAFLKWLGETCRAGDIPLVADEIQTGMGRTGTFLASEQMGLRPDYICLSKALGGGLVKIGALLIKHARFVPEFALKHTSTFAEDDLSCLVALQALEILESEQLPTRCAQAGRYLLEKLEEVRALFPRQIREVRGRGLMIGIELMDQSDSPSNFLKLFSDPGYLGWIAAAYLLNVHHIRIAPTLSDPFTLRIEPSAYISPADMDHLVNAIRTLAEALELADVGYLTGFPFGLTRNPQKMISALPMREQPITPTTPKVSFLGNWIAPRHAVHFDPSLKGIPTNNLQAYLEKSSLVAEPTIYDRVNVHSQTGEVVHLSFIGLNLLPDQIIQMKQSGDLMWVQEQIGAAVELARDAGCSVVGLGGYLSSVTPPNLFDPTNGVTLTAGNALTVGMGIEALIAEAARVHIALAQAHLAVVGAPGSIARTVALMMASHVQQLTLISRSADLSSLARLHDLVAQIQAASPNTALAVSDRLDVLRSCSLIVTTTTSGGNIIKPEHLVADEPLIICDISLPRDVSFSVTRFRPNARIISGGIVRLPCTDDFLISGIPLPRGHALACMVEALQTGLERRTIPYTVSPEGVMEAMADAKRHSFTLADLRRKRNV